MKSPKSALLVGVGVASIGTLGIIGSTSAFATNSVDAQNSSLVDRIAEKFNIDKAELQRVFDEEHVARHADMTEKRAAALDKALAAEKITQDQYDYIKSAWTEIDSLRAQMMADANVDQSVRDEVKDKMQELKDWMKTNDISPSDIGLSNGLGMGGRGHGPFSHKTDAEGRIAE